MYHARTTFRYFFHIYCILAIHSGTTQLEKLSFNHSIDRTHSSRFSIFITSEKVKNNDMVRASVAQGL